MPQKSHDHNFKNLFADFPKEAFEWILPVTPMLFDKYADFIDIYAGIREEERESLCQEIEDKKEETTMLMQYFRDKFSQEGRREGLSESLKIWWS